MPTVNHADLTGANLHEPKGVSAAAINKVYLSDGAASGTWQKLPTQGLLNISSNGSTGDNVHVDGSGNFLVRRPTNGGTYFVDLVTPYALTYPATYTKLAPTTTALGSSTEVTEATTARLTYTGTPNKRMEITCNISFAQSVGANRDIEFALYKNGSVVPGSNIVSTTTTALKQSVSLSFHNTMSTNDYVEVFAKNAGGSGDLAVYSFYLSMVSIKEIN